MFVNKYFADRYFAPRYFPKLGEAIVEIFTRLSLIGYTSNTPSLTGQTHNRISGDMLDCSQISLTGYDT